MAMRWEGLWESTNTSCVLERKGEQAQELIWV